LQPEEAEKPYTAQSLHSENLLHGDPIFLWSSAPKMQRLSVVPKDHVSYPRQNPIEREEAEIVVLMRISSILSGSGRVVYKGAWTKLQRFSVGRHEILGEPIDFPKIAKILLTKLSQD
jgi:hypothetical protein